LSDAFAEFECIIKSAFVTDSSPDYLDQTHLCRVAGVPHKGWHLIGVTDLREDEGLSYGDYESCEFCGQEQIRFVHTLQHVDYPNEIRVGCICSCDLTDDYEGPVRLERILRNGAARRARFPSRRGWRSNQYGGRTIKLDGFLVTVGMKQGKHRVWINSKEGRLFYDTPKAAMLQAFDHVQHAISKRRSN
jgi:hypothetical protein